LEFNITEEFDKEEFELKMAAQASSSDRDWEELNQPISPRGTNDPLGGLSGAQGVLGPAGNTNTNSNSNPLTSGGITMSGGISPGSGGAGGISPGSAAVRAGNNSASKVSNASLGGQSLGGQSFGGQSFGAQSSGSLAGNNNLSLQGNNLQAQQIGSAQIGSAASSPEFSVGGGIHQTSAQRNVAVVSQGVPFNDVTAAQSSTPKPLICEMIRKYFKVILTS
jgi:hypothetical protein